MILILPQIQFEAIPSKDAGEVAFQSETDRRSTKMRSTIHTIHAIHTIH